MPTPTVEFIFDFASPNAYLVHKTIDGLVARTRHQYRVYSMLTGRTVQVNR